MIDATRWGVQLPILNSTLVPSATPRSCLAMSAEGPPSGRSVAVESRGANGPRGPRALGIGQAPSAPEGATRELYWVTDGQGRQYGIASPTGTWNHDMDPGTGSEGWWGYLQAGGITEAGSYNASRQGASGIPGVSYFRNRIYDQSSGQWTQEDPIGLAGGMNLYQYAGGNPAGFTDPFGLKIAFKGDSTGELQRAFQQAKRMLWLDAHSGGETAKVANEALNRIMAMDASTAFTTTVHWVRGHSSETTQNGTDIAISARHSGAGKILTFTLVHELGHAWSNFEPLNHGATNEIATGFENAIRRAFAYSGHPGCLRIARGDSHSQVPVAPPCGDSWYSEQYTRP